MQNVELVSLEDISSIRRFINEPYKQYLLLQDKKKWLRLTAALDVLEDSSCAIQYYCANDYPENIHGKYLFTYGLLQALFLQQDAILALSLSLIGSSVDFKNDFPNAYIVRELRNDVVGHPTNRAIDKEPFFTYLAQISMSKNSFYYIKDSPDNSNTQCIDVDINTSISNTSSAVNCVLAAIFDFLMKEHQEYISKHKDRKMIDIFNNLDYAREKVLLNTVMKPAGYSSTKKMVEAFEQDVILRYGSINTIDSIGFILKDIHELYDLIDDNLDRFPPDIYATVEKYLLECLFSKLFELRECSKELDEYFNGTNVEKSSDSTQPTNIIDDI